MKRMMLICQAIAIALLFLPAAECKNSEISGVIVETKVMASPGLAFAALRELRNQDSQGCRVLSSSSTESVVEETFDGLPVIGRAVCVYTETYEPSRRMSFKMLRSDRLKAFEGEWTLQPIDNGAHTLVRLRTYIDTGLTVPFVKQITESVSSKELKEQISSLKSSAERRQRTFDHCQAKSLGGIYF